MENIAHIVVPEWYRNAKSSGDTKPVLKEKIRQFCIEAAKRRPAGDASTDTAVDDELITITFDMYEHAITSGQ